MSEQLKVSDEKAWGLGMAMLGAIPWIVNNDSDPEGPYEIWHCMGPGGKIGEFADRSHAMSCVAIHNTGLDLLSDRATLKRMLEEAEKRISLAGGYHSRTPREVEIEEALNETPVADRDTADVAIGELLELVDAGRNRIHEEVEKREAAERQLEEARRENDKSEQVCLEVIGERDGYADFIHDMARKFSPDAEWSSACDLRTVLLNGIDESLWSLDQLRSKLSAAESARDEASKEANFLAKQQLVVESDNRELRKKLAAAIQRAEKAEALAKRLSTAIDEARASLLASAEPFDKGCKTLIDAALSPPAPTPEATESYPNIERCCQIHEEVRIVYLVDGYNAELFTKDGDVRVRDADGATVHDALRHLNISLADTDLDDVRGVMHASEPVPQPAAEAVPDLKPDTFWNTKTHTTGEGCWWFDGKHFWYVRPDGGVDCCEDAATVLYAHSIVEGRLDRNRWPIPAAAQREIDRIKQGKDGE